MEVPHSHDPEMALAGTETPVIIRVRPIADERAPEGTVCLGTFIDERLVARCVVPPELHETLERHSVFRIPVRLVLSAREGPPGLQCQLFALAPLPPEAVRDADSDAEPEEPWANSLPGARYDAATQEGEEGANGRHDEPIAVIPLGQIVRFAHDRRHPSSLSLEAADVLGRIVQGKVVEVVDKVLEDILRNDDEDE
jgi:hypothetical protein